MRGTRKVLRMPICFERSSQYGTARSYVRLPPLPRSPAVFIQHKDGVALLMCGLAMVCMVLFVIAGNISIQQCIGA